MTEPVLTIFATPKPFDGHIGVIQRNALGSWVRVQGAESVLLGASAGTEEAALDHGVRHIPDVDCNPWGTPYVADLFARTEAVAAGPLLCYTNADILLPANIVSVAAMVAARLERFIIVGRRWNVDIDIPIDFQPDWEQRMHAHARQTGRLHPPTGIDYFIFPKGMLGGDLPPFSVGRVRWDNWMLYNARLLGIPVIDATDAIECWHQNHDYAHIHRDTPDHTDTDEQRFNKMLAFGEFFTFTLDDCSHILAADGHLIGATDQGRTPRDPPVVFLPGGQHWMVVPGDLSGDLSEGRYRPDLFGVLDYLLRPGMTFLDVGAHHGAVTLAARRRVGDHGLVVAVEPSVRELMVLRMQLTLNRIDDVVIVPAALTDRTGPGIFHINRSLENGRNGIREPENMLRGRQVSVRFETLDSVVAGLKRQPDIVKINLSHVDVSLLDGAVATLGNKGAQPVLLLTPDWGRCPDARNWLTGAGYRLTRWHEGTLQDWSQGDGTPDTLVALPSA